MREAGRDRPFAQIEPLVPLLCFDLLSYINPVEKREIVAVRRKAVADAIAELGEIGSRAEEELDAADAPRRDDDPVGRQRLGAPIAVSDVHAVAAALGGGAA